MNPRPTPTGTENAPTKLAAVGVEDSSSGMGRLTNDTGNGRTVRARTAQDPRPAPRLVIEASRGWSAPSLRELWQYRGLIYFLFIRDFHGRYRQMALGKLWVVIKPIASMLVFSLVFGSVLQLPADGLPYPIFSFTALLPWTLFTGALAGASMSLIQNMDLISKVYFPRLVTPITSAVVGLVDFAVSFLVLLGMVGYYYWAGEIAFTPRLALLTLPLFLILALATAMGLGLWLASLAARFRDVEFAVGFLLQFWMYLSPVVYPTSSVPERWRFLYQLNPMTQVIDGFRWALLGIGQPPGLPLLLSGGLVLVALTTGAYVFRRTERTVVDNL